MLGSARTKLPPLTLTSWVKVATSFVLQTWNLYKKKDRILGKRNMLHKLFTITINKFKCIVISNYVFKSNWMCKILEDLGETLHWACKSKTKMIKNPFLIWKKPHSLQYWCFGWYTWCFGWSTWCRHEYGVFVTFGTC